MALILWSHRARTDTRKPERLLNYYSLFCFVEMGPHVNQHDLEFATELWVILSL